MKNVSTIKTVKITAYVSL